jgi:hypothetical protein
MYNNLHWFELLFIYDAIICFVLVFVERNVGALRVQMDVLLDGWLRVVMWCSWGKEW